MTKKKSSKKEYKPKRLKVAIEYDQLTFEVSKSQVFSIDMDDVKRILNLHPTTGELKTSDFKGRRPRKKYPEAWFSEDFVAHVESMAEMIGASRFSTAEMASELGVDLGLFRKWIGDLEVIKERREVMKKRLAQDLLEKYREQYAAEPEPEPEFNAGKVVKMLVDGMSPRQIDDHYRKKGQLGFLRWYERNMKAIEKVQAKEMSKLNRKKHDQELSEAMQHEIEIERNK